MQLKNSLSGNYVSKKKSLIKAYAISTQYFPYKFMTEDNLNYSGLVPNKSFIDNISEYKDILYQNC